MSANQGNGEGNGPRPRAVKTKWEEREATMRERGVEDVRICEMELAWYAGVLDGLRMVSLAADECADPEQFALVLASLIEDGAKGQSEAMAAAKRREKLGRRRF
jgi:hypothetical protein